MSERRERVRRHYANPAERRRYNNIISALHRRRRRLKNSMSHTPKPRPADLERWRVMEAEIRELERAAAAMRPDLHQGGNDGSAT